MSIFSPFRLPRHRRFHYQPRHYDPDREELMARKARIQSEENQSDYQAGAYIRSGFRRNATMADKRWGSPQAGLLTNALFAAGVVGSLILYRYVDGYENVAVMSLLGSFGFFVYAKIKIYRHG